MDRVKNFLQEAARGKKIVMLTAYDAPSAEIMEKCGVDVILVGDSVGMVVLGYSSTVPVTMDEMIHHAKAVRRGAPNSFIIGDLPLKGVEKGPQQTLSSAKRFIEEAGCDAVKLEWAEHALSASKLLHKNKIPFMGHVGLTPQTAEKSGGYGVRANTAESALEVFANAREFEKSGAFGLVVECVPAVVTQLMSKKLKTPIIGIGSGASCAGQVLVFHDLIGFFNRFRPRFVKTYANIEPLIRTAVTQYAKEVRSKKFPSKKHCFLIDKNEALRFGKSIR